jgi:VWFA-related protein
VTRRYVAPPCLALLGLALVVSAQDQPTFRAGTRLVQVDVVVRDKNGPVEGLKKQDFTLLDEGKQQQIAVFTATAGRNTQVHAAPLPPGTVSNRLNRQGEPTTSATVLLIDRLNTPVNDQVYANRKITAFLQAHGGKDRIGIYILGSGLRVVQDVTDDPERLHRAAQSVKPQDARRMSPDDIKVEPTGDAVSDDMVTRALEALQDFVVDDRVRTTKEALIAIARHLAKVPGRKNLIWVSGSFPLLIVRAHETIDYSKDVDEATRALNDANVAVYAVDSRGLMPSGFGNAERSGFSAPGRGTPLILPPVGPSGVDTMLRLAGLTGGKAFYNSNGIDDSIQRAMEDSELTYTLGFYPSEDAFDEKFHKLAVRVDRKGSDVRFRQGYFANKVRPGSQPTALSQLLQDPLDSTAVGITVETSPDAAQPASYRVRVSIDLHDLHLERQNDRWLGTLIVSLFVEGSKTARNVIRKIDIPDAQLAAALEKGIEVSDSVNVEGAAGSLRVVAQDQSTGAAGSVRVALGKR